MRAIHGCCYRLLAIFLCLLMTPLPSLSQGMSSSQPAGQISALVPQATRNGTVATVNEGVMWNDLLRTEGAGRARVTLKDGSMLSLGSNSELKVVQHDATTQQTEIELSYGRVRSHVMPITKPGGRFQVKTSAAVAGVVGTDFIVISEAGRTQVIVLNGVVQVMSLNGVILGTVNPGQMVNVVNGQMSPPMQTPPGIQQTTISQTNAGSSAGGGVGGGAAGGGAAGGGAVAGGTLLHTLLVVVGAVAASSAVTVVTANQAPNSGDTSGTPCPDAIPRRGHRTGSCSGH